MKSSDYKTDQQAQDYHVKRFANGLKNVGADEANILNSWIKHLVLKNRVFLDLGSGTGRVIQELLSHDPEIIYALDSSKAMLNLLKKNHSQEAQSGLIKIIYAPSDKIPLPSGSTNLVTSCHLFKHLAALSPTLKEVKRILKKKGYVSFDTLNSHSIIRLNMGTCTALTENELRKELKSHGFKVKRIVFLHPLGESVYKFSNIFSLPIIHILEKALNTFNLGTKIFILAQKI